MLTKKVTYEDFNGNTVTEELQFNLTKTEAMDIAFALPDDVKKTVQTGPEDVTEELAKKILARMGDTKIFDFIKTVVLKAYGEVSEDGRKFIKKDENGKDLSIEFSQSLAYDAIITELMTSDETAAMNFVNALLPGGLANAVPAKTN